jgi:hypothetical protein
MSTEFETQLELLRTWAAQRGIPIVEKASARWRKRHTAIELESTPETWAPEHFLKTCEQLQPDFMLLNVLHFEQQELEAAKAALEEWTTRSDEEAMNVDGEPDQEAPDLKGLIRALKSAGPRLGDISVIELVAWQSASSLRIVYRWSPAWYCDVSSIEPPPQLQHGLTSHFNSPETNLTEPEYEELSDSLSRHRGFQTATGPVQQAAAAAASIGSRFKQLNRFAQGRLLQLAQERYLLRETLSEEEISKLATQVADDQSFQRDERLTQRKVLLEAILGAEVLRRPGSKAILPRAVADFERRVRPLLDKAATERIMSLLGSGLSIGKVADELGLTQNEVRRLRRLNSP